MSHKLQILTEEQINSFFNNGIVIIPNILTPYEIQLAQNGFHSFLIGKGIEVNNLIQTASALSGLSSTGGAGGILDIFYEPFKLCISEHPKIVAAIQDIWSRSYADNNALFNHPYGKFDPNQAYMYIDRVCYRIPTPFAESDGAKSKKPLQRSLAPHLDCCPHEMYLKDSRKWRPIQAFVSLTDTFNTEEGGFEAVLGFHKQFFEWAKTRPNSFKNSSVGPPCVGNFTPIRPDEDATVLNQFQHIPCKAGDLVCWDYRIPHANSRYNNSSIPREVIYIGLLPPILLNKVYAREQLERLKQGLPPDDIWHKSCIIEKCNYQFSDLGKKLLTIDEWE